MSALIIVNTMMAFVSYGVANRWYGFIQFANPYPRTTINSYPYIPGEGPSVSDIAGTRVTRVR